MSEKKNPLTIQVFQSCLNLVDKEMQKKKFTWKEKLIPSPRDRARSVRCVNSVFQRKDSLEKQNLTLLTHFVVEVSLTARHLSIFPGFKHSLMGKNNLRRQNGGIYRLSLTQHLGEII